MMVNIERAAILHIPKSNMAYCYDKDRIHIVLRAKKNNLKEVIFHCSEPFEPKVVVETNNYDLNLEKTAMRKVGSTEIYDYWFISVRPPFKRLSYYFELASENERIYYSQKGFYPLEKIKSVQASQFSFPWMNEIDIFDVPTWVKDTIWYQIFPERFANGNPEISPKNVLAWNSEAPAADNFFGGDLQGIIDHLDHLVELGINGLYLCPIFKARTNHKYDTIDYFEIDPHFGDKKTFKKLVEECHKRNIKVMLDAVFNHFGYWHPYWQDVLKNQEKSKYKDWFYINKFPVKKLDENLTENTSLDLNYYTFAFTGYMPKVNTSNPEVKKYLLEVARYWVEEFDIDAWRLDVANEIDHHFWREFRQVVNQKKRTYILGEVWSDSNPWLKGDQFDGVMNYVLTRQIIDFVATREIDVRRFKNRVTNVIFLYQKNIWPGMFNCLASHDTARLLTLCENDPNRLKLAYSILFTLSGSPSIYYGDETGINGNHDPDCRKCMIWDKSQWNLDIFNHLKNLIKVRKAHPTIGSYGFLEFKSYDEEKQYLEYIKTDTKTHYLILVNNSDNQIEVEHSDLINNTELLTNEKQTSSKVVLKPLSMKIFKLN
ncbi:glycoside hydrolase family 13 protein [Mycoplasma mycoides]|nr:glycoside hydrolase family 13 protein [Mycoplasma mycoides]MDP4040389.1 glycoside hydrolase family 13 protein [Mycoplasma mycoides]MDP4047123.1 glycoside hydrolase family 13 protein [Mycoplasma mycoides]MDP4058189.1 glycoside hydrolase family 13 protein [Mycoplasma mycoides]MDP4058964.1 glycoside hydrolase family 13 protein [Mycoplasma mycoides]MDP4059687.1 glycoside hydrolase family 13 protein [Mycoplasma mycoides]